MFSIFLIFWIIYSHLNVSQTSENLLTVSKPRWASPNPNTDVDRWIKPYRPIAVIGLALRDRLLRDMREANIWKFAMPLRKTMLVDPFGSNNKVMSCFCHFWIFWATFGNTSNIGQDGSGHEFAKVDRATKYDMHGLWVFTPTCIFLQRVWSIFDVHVVQIWN
jgi:hypothetical protein